MNNRWTDEKGDLYYNAVFLSSVKRAVFPPIHGLHQPFEMAIIVNVNLESLNLYVSLPQKRVIQISGRLNEKKMPFSYLFPLWSRVLFAVVPTQLQCMTG